MDDSINSRIKDLRDQKGWSQAKLAKKASLSPGYVGEVERGTAKNIGIETLEAIAKAFEIDLEYLIFGVFYSDNALRKIQDAADEIGKLSGYEKKIIAKLRMIPGDSERKGIEEVVDTFIKMAKRRDKSH